jgi:hypothetical protein
VYGAPPRFSWVTSSPVTVFTTFGPVRNMYEVFSIIRMKSVNAGRVDRSAGAGAEDTR